MVQTLVQAGAGVTEVRQGGASLQERYDAVFADQPDSSPVEEGT